MPDRPELIRRHAQHIHAQAVATRAMPPGNLTEMTEAERRLAAWLAAGRPLD